MDRWMDDPSLAGIGLMLANGNHWLLVVGSSRSTINDQTMNDHWQFGFDEVIVHGYGEFESSSTDGTVKTSDGA